MFQVADNTITSETFLLADSKKAVLTIVRMWTYAMGRNYP